MSKTSVLSKYFLVFFSLLLFLNVHHVHAMGRVQGVPDGVDEELMSLE